LLKQQLDATLSQVQAQEQTSFQKQCKTYFLHWVELSYISDSNSQEVEMNSFFEQVRSFLQIERDQQNLYQFCNVGIRTSIDLSRQNQHGHLRENNNLLNYHFIDSFIKLTMLLLKAFDFNKADFMAKILEQIRLKLEDDHQKQGANFNQKPYHRMFINILTAVNISDCFKTRTQCQVLFDMAEMFLVLQPTRYPAFAFAWLELISHRLFLPHFIKRTDSQQNQAWHHIKDLLVGCFTFLKRYMLPGQKATKAMEAFYVGTIRIFLLILKDYPDFLCDFHFNFVNSLPEHAI
jgi:CCR4-NOT transcription complex subunit 1